jgi:hypothetical protein
VERLLIAIGVILAFVIIVALLPKKLSLTEVDRPSLSASVSPENHGWRHRSQSAAIVCRCNRDKNHFVQQALKRGEYVAPHPHL